MARTAPDFVDYLIELLTALGSVTAKRMFSGYGLFIDGMMFAIVVDDAVWFKTDGESRADFEALGLPRFTYLRKGQPAALNFFRPPDEALDSSELLLPWARSALAAALRTRASAKPRTRPR